MMVKKKKKKIKQGRVDQNTKRIESLGSSSSCDTITIILLQWFTNGV